MIDVREPYERGICHIGGQLVPLSDVESQLFQFDKDKVTIVYCKSGARSAQAVEVFLNAGFNDVFSLDGGVLNWQAIIDQTLMRY